MEASSSAGPRSAATATPTVLLRGPDVGAQPSATGGTAACPRRRLSAAPGLWLRKRLRLARVRRAVVSQRSRAAVGVRATARSAFSKHSRALMVTAAVVPLPVAAGTRTWGSEQLPAA
jgi:hypothetical protein